VRSMVAPTALYPDVKPLGYQPHLHDSALASQTANVRSAMSSPSGWFRFSPSVKLRDRLTGISKFESYRVARVGWVRTHQPPSQVALSVMGFAARLGRIRSYVETVE
jgi:hypothetical protein